MGSTQYFGVFLFMHGEEGGDGGNFDVGLSGSGSGSGSSFSSGSGSGSGSGLGFTT
jgi:hypothetical protein